MTEPQNNIEPRRKLHPNDKLGLFGALILPLILAMLWFGGHGPFDQQACRIAEDRRALDPDLESNGTGVRLSGVVASEADRPAQ